VSKPDTLEGFKLIWGKYGLEDLDHIWLKIVTVGGLDQVWDKTCS